MRLQEKLKELGYLSSSVDGDYGAKTEKAVMEAQKAAGMWADGVATPEFQAWLFRQSSPAPSRKKIAITGNVYLWKRPSDSDEDDKICVAYKGTKLNWDGDQRSGTYKGSGVTWYYVQYPDIYWYEVRVDDVTGWISEIYCRDQGNGMLYMFGGKAQLRGSPSLDGKRLNAYVYEGDRISISGARRELKEGPSGWVPSKYAEVSG